MCVLGGQGILVTLGESSGKKIKMHFDGLGKSGVFSFETNDSPMRSLLIHAILCVEALKQANTYKMPLP